MFWLRNKNDKYQLSTLIYLSVKWQIFSYPYVLTFVLGAQKNHLNETVILSTHNIFFKFRNKNSFFGILLISEDLNNSTTQQGCSGCYV